MTPKLLPRSNEILKVVSNPWFPFSDSKAPFRLPGNRACLWSCKALGHDLTEVGFFKNIALRQFVCTINKWKLIWNEAAECSVGV